MIQEKFNQYFHTKGFKFIQLRNGVVFEDETLADGSTRLKSKQYVEQKNEDTEQKNELILLQESPIDGLLSPDVIKSKIKDEHWNPFSYSLEPIDESQASIKKKVVRMSDFYDFLVQKYEENKRGIFTLNEIILQSVTKYGMLTIGKYKEKVWTAHEYKLIDKYNNRDLNKGTNILKKRDEFRAWLFVFESLIPSTLEYVGKNQYKLTEEMLNFRIRNIEVEFENTKNNKLKISPNDLMSALILYAKTKSIKKLPIVNCLYCDKPFKQKVAPGRPQKFCSPSHKNMYNLNMKKKKTKNT